MEVFIIRAILVTIGICVVTGPLGCFVVWKRMSYFSESISHSALLGVALGLISGFNINLSLVLVSVFFAFFIILCQQRNFLPNDAILGIFAHVAIAIGIVVLSLIDNAGVDYFGFLFGDILSINNNDVVWVYMIMVVVISLLCFFWERLLLITLSEDLAIAEGLKHNRYKLLLMLMVALSVSIAVQIIGVLLITALLIIPPVIAMAFAKTPIKMVFGSILVAITAMIIGLFCSTYYDLATGPIIVIVLGILFIISQLSALATKK